MLLAIIPGKCCESFLLVFFYTYKLQQLFFFSALLDYFKFMYRTPIEHGKQEGQRSLTFPCIFFRNQILILAHRIYMFTYTCLWFTRFVLWKSKDCRPHGSETQHVDMTMTGLRPVHANILWRFVIRPAAAAAAAIALRVSEAFYKVLKLRASMCDFSRADVRSG